MDKIEIANVRLCVSKTDPDMIEITSMFGTKRVLWGVIHADFLNYDTYDMIKDGAEIRCALVEI